MLTHLLAFLAGVGLWFVVGLILSYRRHRSKPPPNTTIEEELDGIIKTTIVSNSATPPKRPGDPGPNSIMDMSENVVAVLRRGGNSA